MLRTRLAQAAAVATLALSTALLLPATIASAQPAAATTTTTVDPNNLIWGS